MFTIPRAPAPVHAAVRLHTTRATRVVIARSTAYDALSGYQKNRMQTARTDADWAAIEKDIPGARAMYASAQRARATTPTTTKDPMDALCDADPGAIECKAFD